MQTYQSKIPACIYAGENCTAQLNTILEKEKVKRVIVFTDKGVRSAGLLDPVLPILAKAGIGYDIVDDLTPEPSYLDVARVSAEIENANCDMIIAVGGGSVMDTAKLCAVLKGADYSIKDLLDNAALAQKQMCCVMIPTTCGTGSEATCNAIVLIPEQDVKVGIVSDNMIPDYVLLDPLMIAKLPPAIVASTGVDALAHAVECYTSNKANPLSDVYALASAVRIFKNIRAAYHDPDDLSAKTAMLIGAFYGGVAITSSGTTAVHALSYPLGGKFHIPHGVSNAILFAPVMAVNMDACADRLSDICDAIRPDKFSLPILEKAQFVVDEIASIVKDTQIPTNLTDFGVKNSDLEFLVQAGSGVTRLLSNNCKTLSLQDIRAIYQKVL